jgi:hypothetical protein
MGGALPHLTKEANDTLKSLHDCSGLYFLYDSSQELMYIGRSSNLRNRIKTSAIDKKMHSFKYLNTRTVADTYILEPIYIATFKPPLNSEFSLLEVPTIKIDMEIQEPKMETIPLFIDKKSLTPKPKITSTSKTYFADDGEFYYINSKGNDVILTDWGFEWDGGGGPLHQCGSCVIRCGGGNCKTDCPVKLYVKQNRSV